MNNLLSKRLLSVFIFFGAITVIFIVLVYFLKPSLIDKVKTKGLSYYYSWQINNENAKNSVNIAISNEDIIANWEPLSFGLVLPNTVTINSIPYYNLTEAVASLEDGDELVIGSGIYKTPLIIEPNNITIKGDGHVVFAEKTAKGKGVILAKGDNLSVINIECHNVRVRDGNGACVRLEGNSLELSHVYFHDSQQGVLSGKNSGAIFIDDSRFENLGKSGQAHGIYIGSGELYINNSLFISSKDEGHEIKSRAKTTEIRNSIIASLNGRDSRLVDLSDGGRVILENNIFQQGNNTSNSDVIGFALEKNKHKENSIVIKKNVFLLDRLNGSQILHTRDNEDNQVITGNTIIGKYFDKNIDKSNILFESRNDAGIDPFPALIKQ